MKEQQRLQKEAQLNRMKLTNFFTDKQKPAIQAHAWTSPVGKYQPVKN